MSVTLPRALRPWTEPLALFGEVVHDGVGRWLHPLRSLMGPLSVPHSAAAGEPDGYCGLTRRGSYERLLLGEWALALEAPDEFLRRAAAKEHVFIDRAFREPRSSHASVALLDCGPRQLGRPRLVHIAALVVLQQRATEGSASFQLGVLQDDQHRLHALDSAAILSWLRQRTHRPGHEGHEGWGETLREQAAPDLWVIGGPDLAETARRLGASRLEIEEHGPSSARGLRVRAWRPGHPGTSVELPVPPAETCVQILRAPRARPQRPPPRSTDTSPAAGPLGHLSLDGRRWLLPDTGGGIQAHHVPNTPAEPPGNLKQILPLRGSTLIAADMKGKRPVALAVAEDGELLLRGGGLALPGEAPARSVAGIQHLNIPTPQTLRSVAALDLFVIRAEAFEFLAWIHDHLGQLWELHIELHRKRRDDPVKRCELTLRDTRCRIARRVDSHTLAWVSDTQQRVLSVPSKSKQELSLTEEQRVGCLIGPLPDHGDQLSFGYPDGDRFLIHHFGNHDQDYSFRLPEGRIFGLRKHYIGHEIVPGLVFVDPKERRVCTVDQGGTPRLLLTTRTPLETVRYEPACDRFLWCTEDGERGVYDVGRQAVVRRLPPPGAEESG